MYEWSKEIMEKINKANILDYKNLLKVEMALRMSEIYDNMMNEALDLNEDSNIYELKYNEYLKWRCKKV